MNWQIILKRRLTSKYFKELKTALLDVVRRIPSGTKFNVLDLEQDFIAELKNHMPTKIVGNFNKGNPQRWLQSTGSSIINRSGLVIEGREKLKGHVRK
jgi:hypothetical protein